MSLRRFKGYGDAPSDSDVQFAQAALAELTQSQNGLKTVYNDLRIRCLGLDPQLQVIIKDSDDDVDYIQSIFNDFIGGGIAISDVVGVVNDHVAANDLLIQKMNTYQCDTGVLANGQVGQRVVSSNGTTSDAATNGRAASGVVTGGSRSGTISNGGSVIPSIPKPVTAGMGSFGWLALLGLLGYIVYEKYAKKPIKKMAVQRRSTKRTKRLKPVKRSYYPKLVSRIKRSSRRA